MPASRPLAKGRNRLLEAGGQAGLAEHRAQVTKAETADYCERVLRGFVDRRTDGESFAHYVSRADEDWLL